jgi:hypothetical protein
MAQPATSALPVLPRSVTRGHEARHLLALPADVVVDEVEVLAMSRFVGTRWDVVPADLSGADGPGARRARSGEPGVLRLSRHSTLTGPYAPAGQGFDPGLPAGTELVFDVVTPRERWDDPPVPGEGDRDGLARSFPAALPNREEERVVSWLVAVARRLGGSLRLDVAGLWDPAVPDDRRGSGTVLTPDPAAAVDLAVFSDVWLDPQACQQVAQAVHPAAALATEGADYQGPPPGLAERPLFGGDDLDDDERRELHARADDVDIAALQAPQVLDGYGVVTDLGPDGYVTIEVMGEEALPLLLRDLPWTQGGCVAYHVRWDPPDVAEAQREQPHPALVAARGRAAEVVAGMARALWDAVGGEIADEADFLVDPEDL